MTTPNMDPDQLTLICVDIDAVVGVEPAFGGLSSDPELKIACKVATANRWGAAMRSAATALKTMSMAPSSKLFAKVSCATTGNSGWYRSSIPTSTNFAHSTPCCDN
ncbi:MAG: hypothetical protein OEN02_08480 [Gammaproteobacteria bacterium]|nr:hypothetical protein [Gammaproteobacteria bacterium]